VSENVVFISDIHMDHEVPRRIERFERFLLEDLTALGCRRLFLLGDIFNIWYKDSRVAQLYGDRLLTLIGKFAMEGNEVEWVVGNRDFALGFDPRLELPFPLHSGPIFRQVGSRQFYLCHGDNLCKKDYGYHLLHGAIRQRFPMAVFHSLGSDAQARIVAMLINLTHEAKKRKAQWRTEPYLPFLRGLVEEGVDVCIQGHKHDQTYRVLEAETRTGTHFILPRWFDRAVGLVYEPQPDRFRFFDLP
jgi:UDP-2,3-diacylglucosamine hydrolase